MPPAFDVDRSSVGYEMSSLLCIKSVRHAAAVWSIADYTCLLSIESVFEEHGTDEVHPRSSYRVVLYQLAGACYIRW